MIPTMMRNSGDDDNHDHGNFNYDHKRSQETKQTNFRPLQTHSIGRQMKKWLGDEGLSPQQNRVRFPL